ncbi:inositol 1,4,5-trisphosphate receptor-like protein A isoform X2 [Drosophila willistoni]|uniref:inositol 1,4,5-trisphosphate receptor-like protein A isoform X2 n=1 Tax=Drosophila willistoni TaxID=7260 RepID=UPI001F079841|nr:inositol 1,4,5-trisphosphate receptor-like protein A isoform X2 [Drosophila willistoni]
MVKTRELSFEIRSEIVMKFQFGFTASELANVYNISKKQVNDLLKKKKKRNANLQNSNKSGRKLAMTKRKCKRLKSVNAKNPFSSPIKLATESSVKLLDEKVSTVKSPVRPKPRFQYLCKSAGDVRLREWILYESHALGMVKFVRLREMSVYRSCPRLELSLYMIEHETELGILDRRTSTPSPINYYKATDLTYNHRKRKAQMDENGCDGVGVGGGGIGIGIGVAGVGSVLEQHVVGALTLTPITKTATSQQMTNHRQLAFQALQQHFNHNHSGISINSSSNSSNNNNNISGSSNGNNNNNHNDSSHCNGQMHLQHHHQHHNNHHHHHQHHQQQQQLQQQHSNNMALKRDRDRDLSSLVNTSTSLELTSSSSATAGATISSSSLSSGAATSSSSAAIATTSASATPIKPSHIDEYGIFGEYVAITIRKLKTTKSKIVVKHLINNLLYEAELGKYDHGIPASKEPPQLYKMQ